MAKPDPAIVPSVSMPSADLINFRFDQNDKKLDGITVQIDSLINGLATKEELTDLKEESAEEYKRLWGAINGIKASAKWWVATIIAGTAAIAAVIVGVVEVLK